MAEKQKYRSETMAAGGLGGAMSGLSLGGPGAGFHHGKSAGTEAKHPVECRQATVVIEGVATEVIFSR